MKKTQRVIIPPTPIQGEDTIKEESPILEECPPEKHPHSQPKEGQELRPRKHPHQIQTTVAKTKQKK